MYLYCKKMIYVDELTGAERVNLCRRVKLTLKDLKLIQLLLKTNNADVSTMYLRYLTPLHGLHCTSSQS